MKIGVIGAGRLGLAFALVCDQKGIETVISDKNETYLKNLKNGFYLTNEPYISDLLSKKRFLEIVDSNEEVITKCDYIWTFVDTPSKEDGTYDIEKLMSVVENFTNSFKDGKNLEGKTFVIGCTTNPGDSSKIAEILNQISVQVVYNPEFVAQGEIVKNLEESKMVLIGCREQQNIRIIINLYRNICNSHVTFNIMSYSAAELTKISVNCFLTTKIAFSNMIGEIAINSGLENEVGSILTAIGSDPRINNKFLKYGFGFGGPCLPRDNRSLSAFAKRHGTKANLSNVVDEMNNDHTKFLFDYYTKKNPDKTNPFVMKHISYKKGTDILVDSQQYNLCLLLLSDGYTVHVNEIESVIQQFKNKDLGEMTSRLKFFKFGKLPEGYLIDL